MSTGIYKNGQFVKTAGMVSGYEVFKPATETTDGSTGLVVAPLKGDQNKFLKGDGTWGTAEGSGSTVTVTPTLTSGTQVATIKVDDKTSVLYSPEVPDELADLTDDATHRLVTDTEKATWNGKSDFDGNYSSLTGSPTALSAFSNDKGFVNTSTDTTYEAVE